MIETIIYIAGALILGYLFIDDLGDPVKGGIVIFGWLLAFFFIQKYLYLPGVMVLLTVFFAIGVVASFFKLVT